MPEEFTNKEKYELRKQEKDAMRDSVAKRRIFKRAAMWVLITGALGGSVFAVYNFGNTNTPGMTAMIVDAVNASDQIFGVPDSRVVLIEYGDFQCPACAQYEPIVQKIRQDYADKIVFVYRHFPLSQHKNAKITAYASEAAGKQGKFWEMHDKIYAGQNEWANLSNDRAREILTGYAGFIGFDLELFKKQMDSGEIKDKVDADSQSGLKAGVNSTPTFILNGKRIQPRGYDEFKQFIEQELSANS